MKGRGRKDWNLLNSQMFLQKDNHSSIQGLSSYDKVITSLIQNFCI